MLLLDQNRGLWDQLLIRRGLAALARAEALGGARSDSYALQAAIAACHARARTAGETDWQRIAALYCVLAEMTRSPIVELNRAMAVAMADGPAAGLEIVDGLDVRTVAQGLSSAAQRARRPAGQARPAGRGAARIRAGGRDDAQCARARSAAEAGRECGRLRSALDVPPSVLPDISPQGGDRPLASPISACEWQRPANLPPEGRCPAGRGGREGTRSGATA